jgi:hypothetical protein
MIPQCRTTSKKSRTRPAWASSPRWNEPPPRLAPPSARTGTRPGPERRPPGASRARSLRESPRVRPSAPRRAAPGLSTRARLYPRRRLQRHRAAAGCVPRTRFSPTPALSMCSRGAVRGTCSTRSTRPRAARTPDTAHGRPHAGIPARHQSRVRDLAIQSADISGTVVSRAVTPPSPATGDPRAPERQRADRQRGSASRATRRTGVTSRCRSDRRV